MVPSLQIKFQLPDPGLSTQDLSDQIPSKMKQLTTNSNDAV
jgi:hypothetical protein